MKKRRSLIIGIIAVLAALAGAWYWFVGSDYSVGSIDPESQITAEDRATNAGLVGKWQSKEDSNFVREFIDDGTVVDSYKGDGDSSVSTSTWSTFTAKDPDPAATMYLDESAYYVAIRDASEEPYIFSITQLTPDSMTLLYMNRGGVQEYTRLK